MWCIYAVHLLLYLCFVQACVRPNRRTECGPDVAPSNRTNIVSSAGCNDTHIWISWEWRTPSACDVSEVEMKSYTCYTEDESQIEQSYRDDLGGGTELYSVYSNMNMWSKSYPRAWSNPTPMKCKVDGHFEILEVCSQQLHPVNMTCSNSVTVQPTSASSTLMTSSDHNIIMTTASTWKTTQLNTVTVQPTPTVIHTIPEVSYQTTATSHTLTETHIIVIVTVGVVMIMTSVVVCIVVHYHLQRRLQKDHASDYYREDLEEFKPNYSPVIPEKVIFKDDILSIISIIAPLKKISDTDNTVTALHPETNQC